MLALRTRRSAVTFVGVLCLSTCLLALVACSANPSPAPLPSESPSSTTSSSPSPTATPPTLPAEAKGTSEAAAKAFARHYFDVINYSAQTGTTDGLKVFGTNNCQSCASIAKNIDEIYQSGGSIRTKGWTLKGMRTVQATKKSAVLSLDVFLEPEVVVKSSGTDEQRNDGGQQPMTMFLTREKRGWLVSKLDLVA